MNFCAKFNLKYVRICFVSTITLSISINFHLIWSCTQIKHAAMESIVKKNIKKEKPFYEKWGYNHNKTDKFTSFHWLYVYHNLFPLLYALGKKGDNNLKDFNRLTSCFSNRSSTIQ